MFRKIIFVSNLDGLKFIGKMEVMEKEVFVYIDPPYFQKGADLYMNSYKKEGHEKLSERANKMKKKMDDFL